jgi:DNA processing protein
MAQAIAGFRDWDQVEAELARVAAAGAHILTLDDPAFPPALKNIPYPPAFLYVRGELQPADTRAVALVGTRKASYYGLKACRRLARDLAAQGVTLVSGLARGIDTAAHQAALDSGGRTLAVLGCGLDVVYPPENKELYRRIPQQGALVTEFFLGTPPEARNFPIRNRIISGLSRGVVIVEAGAQSGTHITATYALEQGREVFAVPGPIDLPGSVGPHRWIQQGAKLVRDTGDILEELVDYPPWPQLPEAQEAPPGPEDPITSYLSSTPLQLDELIRVAGLPAAEVMSRLTMLELQGLVRELPGKFFVLAG